MEEGVNASLRENRIGHGADADLKRGGLGLVKASRVTLTSWLSFNKIQDTQFVDRGKRK